MGRKATVNPLQAMGQMQQQMGNPMMQQQKPQTKKRQKAMAALSQMRGGK